MELAIMIGLPASGKTTFCKKLKQEGWVIVSPDEIRLTLHGKPFDKEYEDQVWSIARVMAEILLSQGQKVCIDATNINRKSRKPWAEMAKKHLIPLKMFAMETPYETCLKFDSKRKNPLGEDIIKKFHERFEQFEEEEVAGPYIWVPIKREPK